VAGALTGRGGKGPDSDCGDGQLVGFMPDEVGTLRANGHDIGLDTPEHYPLVAPALTAAGHDASEDGTGRQALVYSTLSTNPRGGGGSNGVTQARDLVASSPSSDHPDGAGAPAGLPGRLDDPVRPVACPYDPRPDGPRERQMGNAVTVVVAEWIGRGVVAWEQRMSAEMVPA